ncbi:MAG TPA: hypothetical protein VH325_02710 [Bryobacteraceae bacterium]|nr:hypothetical protein [Bryobacteraceae bacterium]
MSVLNLKLVVRTPGDVGPPMLALIDALGRVHANAEGFEDQHRVFEAREMRIEDSDWMRAASLVFIAELMLF